MHLKETTEKEIVAQAKMEVQNKHFLGEMDSVLAELEQWKKSREIGGAAQTDLEGRVPEEDELNDDPVEDDSVLEEMVRREEKMLV